MRARILLGACLAAAVTAAACTPAPRDAAAPPAHHPLASTAASGTAPARPPSPAASAARPAGPTRAVHVSLLEADGGQYGVGMPIIAWFDRAPTDVSAFTRAVTVTLNGQPAAGAWFWQRSGHAGAAVEAHYRMSAYWPAHARIGLDAPLAGVSAGPGLAYDDSLTLSMSTGPANIATVDGARERMTVTSDGKPVFSFPVSLGAADHPTFTGTKVVMEKDRVQEMKSTPGEPFYDLNVPWSVRLTNSGEFVHAASWNGGNIGVRSTSHGCTNLTVTDAKQYFMFAQIGDPITYSHTGGPPAPAWDGYGDWNVPWPAWQSGGLIR